MMPGKELVRKSIKEVSARPREALRINVSLVVQPDRIDNGQLKSQALERDDPRNDQPKIELKTQS